MSEPFNLDQILKHVASRKPGFPLRGVGGLDDKVELRGSVVFVLKNEETGEKRTFHSKNIVTNDGDIYYAEAGALASPTNTFGNSGTGIMILGTAGNAPAKDSNFGDFTTEAAAGARKSWDSTYPLVDDPDGDNTGAGVDITTYRVSYGTGDANSSGIDRVCIANNGVSSGNPLLMYSTISSVNKTASDTLKVFVNHTFNGV